MKNIRNKIFIIITILLLLIFIVAINIDNNKEIELIQLSAQSKSQMMGYIIKTRNDKLIVIDGGIDEDTQNFMKHINQNGGKVDHWFLTHPHNDHASVFINAVNENVEIENIYVSLNDKEWYEKNEPQRAEFSNILIDTLNKENIKNKVKSPSLNDTLDIDGIKVEILGIRNPEILENCGNEQSMIIKFDTGKTTLLILGDIGQQGSKKLLENQKEKLNSDIVQMSHHGQAGATKELYEAISPKICLWPTPEWLWNNNSGEGVNTRTMENVRNKIMDGRIKSKRKLYS